MMPQTLVLAIFAARKGVSLSKKKDVCIISTAAGTGGYVTWHAANCGNCEHLELHFAVIVTNIVALFSPALSEKSNHAHPRHHPGPRPVLRRGGKPVRRHPRSQRRGPRRGLRQEVSHAGQMRWRVLSGHLLSMLSLREHTRTSYTLRADFRPPCCTACSASTTTAFTRPPTAITGTPKWRKRAIKSPSTRNGGELLLSRRCEGRGPCRHCALLVAPTQRAASHCRADGGKLKTITGVGSVQSCGRKCIEHKLANPIPKKQCETFVYYHATKRCTFSSLAVPEYLQTFDVKQSMVYVPGVPRWCEDRSAQSGYIASIASRSPSGSP